MRDAALGRIHFRKWFGAVFVLCLALLSTSCDGGNTSQSEISVRLKWTFTAHTAAGPGVALARGFFENEGLQVTLNPGGFEFDPVTLVASGSDDFGVKGADDLIIARSRGVPIVAIAMDYQLNPVAFMSLPQTQIRTPADFIGRRIGAKYGQNVYTFLLAMLRDQGVPLDSIEEVPVRLDVSPLLTDQVDVFPGYDNFEPAIFADRGIEVDVLLARDYGVQSYGNVVFASEEIIRNQPEKVLRFLRAYLRGWEWAIENPEETARIMAGLNPDFSESVQQRMMERTIPYVRPEPGFRVGSMTMEGWELTQRVLLDQGLIGEPIDLSEAFTTEFLELVYPDEG